MDEDKSISDKDPSEFDESANNHPVDENLILTTEPKPSDGLPLEVEMKELISADHVLEENKEEDMNYSGESQDRTTSIEQELGGEANEEIPARSDARNIAEEIEDCGKSETISEDDFVDAEESFIHENSEDVLFKSANEISPSVSPAVDEIPPQKNILEFEEPLDPNIFGGHLSARMAKESVWKEAWYHAKPIPIWQQKRLFDDTKEAERVFHEFSQAKINRLVAMILPCLLHASYDRLLKCPDSQSEYIKSDLDKVYQLLKDFCRYFSRETDHFKEVVDEIYAIEMYLSLFNSLRSKLYRGATLSLINSANTKKPTELERRTRRLGRGTKLYTNNNNKESPDEKVDETELLHQLIKNEINLSGGSKSAWGATIQRLFHAQQISTFGTPTEQRQVPTFPSPIGREYILQTISRHPSQYSRECPQRMYVTISSSEFRMAYANSSDKSFI